MQNTPTHHLSSIDRQEIEVLLNQGFEEKEAEKAYFECGRDVIMAADKLHKEREFNPKVTGHFDGLMKGKPPKDVLVELGDSFSLIKDGFDEFEIERQTKEIKLADLAKVNRLKDQGMATHEAI